MPEKRPEYYFYNMNRMHKAFFLSGLLLLLSLVWMLYQDYAREWKDYQVAFMRLDLERTEREKYEAEKRLDQARLAEVKRRLEQAQKDLDGHRKALDALAARLRAKDGELARPTLDYQFAKAKVEAGVVEFETIAAQARAGLARPAEADAAMRRLDKLRAEARACLAALEPLQVERRALEDRQNRLTATRDAAQKEIEELFAQVALFETKIARLQPGFVNTFRNLPFLDFIDPTIKIRQTVLPDYWDDYNFARVFKVDRCVTCHLAIDRKGWDGPEVPTVFRSHPRLDLYVASGSPHPLERFGCTPCHDGQGRSLTFADAAHTPADEKQAGEWRAKYGWHEPTHWDYPMQPKAHVESTCSKCHPEDHEIRGADHWNRGRKLFERAGCSGCHQTDPFSQPRKNGPDLYHLAAKVSEDWTYRWLLDPHAVRPTTRMPRFLGLSNTEDRDDPKRNRAVADAITTYLFSLSETLPLAEPPGTGDVAKGKALFDRVGCRACHVLGDRNDPGDDFNSFGPNLTGIGSKTGRKWLYNWVKDPKALFPETRMPGLRLTDEEAGDLSAFLAAQADPVAPPRVDRPTAAFDAYLDELALGFLGARLTRREAEAELATMKEREGARHTRERKLYVGERFINHFGCFGCHNIRGLERVTPIGVAFTGGDAIGSKALENIDFAYTTIPRTRHDWFALKVRDPRIFDRGRDRAYPEKLRMPYYAWLAEARTQDGKPDDSLVRDLTTFALGLVKTEVPPTYREVLGPRAATLEAGRRILALNNCQACHLVDGKGGETIRAAVADNLAQQKFGRTMAQLAPNQRAQTAKRAFSFAPPPLDIVGERIRPEWVFDFLKKPFQLRVHLDLRMPTFGLSDADAAALVQFFACQSNQPFPYEASEPASHVARWQDPKTGAVVVLKDKEYLKEAKALFKKFECVKCHQGREPGQVLDDLAPDYLVSSPRLKADWVLRFLKEPAKIIPGTRMPKFWPDNTQPDRLGGDTDLQIRAVRDWVMQIRSAEDLK